MSSDKALNRTTPKVIVDDLEFDVTIGWGDDPEDCWLSDISIKEESVEVSSLYLRDERGKMVLLEDYLLDEAIRCLGEDGGYIAAEQAAAGEYKRDLANDR